MVPEISYARSGDVHIAFQSWGEGPPLVGIPPLVQNIQELWGDPTGHYPAWLRRFGGFARVTHLDKRGTGLSDRSVGIAGIEERIDDLRAVMDALHLDRAFVGGISEGGPIAILFAATYPERVLGLVLYGTAARFSAAPDNPAGIARERLIELGHRLAADWGTPESPFTRIWMPSLAGEDAFLEWMRRYERSCASPGAVRDVMRFIADVDVRAALGSINVPALVLHRRNDRVVPAALGRDLAAHIDGARFIELDGEDHVPWLGDGAAVLAEVARFMTGHDAPAPESDRVLATVLFTDIVDSTAHAARMGDRAWRELLDRHDVLVRRELSRHRGSEVKSLGDGFLAVFDSPSRAVRCATSIRDSARALDVDIRAGLHTGELERRGDDIAGVAVHVGARIGALAAASEVLVSGTVRDLVLGSDFTFADRGRHRLKGLDGDWSILAVT